MRWLAFVSCILLLVGCCSGSGPGPRAAIDLESNSQIVIERVS